MSRTFQSTGRNSWRIVNTRRCHSIRIPGDIHGPDYPRQPVSAWIWGPLAVFFVAFVVPLIMGSAS